MRSPFTRSASRPLCEIFYGCRWAERGLSDKVRGGPHPFVSPTLTAELDEGAE